MAGVSEGGSGVAWVTPSQRAGGVGVHCAAAQTRTASSLWIVSLKQSTLLPTRGLLSVEVPRGLRMHAA